MMKGNDRLNLLTERELIAYKLRKEGLKFKEIGERMGICTRRANSLYVYAKATMNSAPKWHDGLSTRLRKCIKNSCINSRDELQRMFLNGKLEKSRHYGWQMHKEVAMWLGLPEPSRPKKHYEQNRATAR